MRHTAFGNIGRAKSETGFWCFNSRYEDDVWLGRSRREQNWRPSLFVLDGESQGTAEVQVEERDTCATRLTTLRNLPRKQSQEVTLSSSRSGNQPNAFEANASICLSNDVRSCQNGGLDKALTWQASANLYCELPSAVSPPFVLLQHPCSLLGFIDLVL